MFAEVWIKRRVDLQDKMLPVLDMRRSRKVEEGQKEGKMRREKRRGKRRRDKRRKK